MIQQALHPIGVFDSGLGGLSILKALMERLPGERFVYFADSGNAPYGERPDPFVVERCMAITSALQQRHHIKSLVVACNTATAAAIAQMRQQFPDLIIIGVEPALKPAVAISQTRHIGVMATNGTLASQKFAVLHNSLRDQAQFHLLACKGLAAAIEAQDTALIEQLCANYLGTLPLGHGCGQVDTIVLGCTHYPLIEDTIKRVISQTTTHDIALVSTGSPVANQTCKRLAEANLLSPMRNPAASRPALVLESSGNLQALEQMAQRHLPMPSR